MSSGPGIVKYPDNIENFQKYQAWGDNAANTDLSSWFTATKHLAGVMGAALGASPYDGESAYDPTIVLNAIEAKYLNMDREIFAMAPEGDWKLFLDEAEENKSTIFPEDDISDDIHTAATGIVAKCLSTANTTAASLVSEATTDTDEEFNLAIAAAGNAAAMACLNTVASSLSAMQTQLVQDEVDAYGESSMDTFNQGVNRFAGQMADVNAIMGSAFVIGISVLEAQRASDIRKFEADLKIRLYETGMRVYSQLYNSLLTLRSETFRFLTAQQFALLQATFQGHLQTHIQSRMQTYEHKAAFLNNAVANMTNSLLGKVKLDYASTSLKEQIGRLKIAAEGTQSDKDLQIAVRDSSWDLDVHRTGAILSSGGASPGYIPKEDPLGAFGSLISGFAKAGEAAAMIG